MDSEKYHVGIEIFFFAFELKGTSDNDGKGHWIMHEFSLINDDQLDHWVLCRIFKKNNKNRPLEVDEDDSEDDMLCTVPPSASIDDQHNAEFFSCQKKNRVLLHWLILEEIVYLMRGWRVMASTMVSFLISCQQKDKFSKHCLILKRIVCLMQ
ncbi:hypothetical protein V6N13_110569 [Hibiscus sabdariffa]|uniref:NAC domain-containing protein n=1 Tax=Hibiscus sabdariffa TaxID=183260 RepID=A0ABR2TI03_9ROSI